AIGHVDSHGMGTRTGDVDEAGALNDVFGTRAATLPLTAIKSYMGNLGAGSGCVELIASVLAMNANALPRVLNYQTPDPECPVGAVVADGVAPGEYFLKLNVTPQGQASCLVVKRCA